MALGSAAAGVRLMLSRCGPRVAVGRGLTRCLLCRQVLELAWREETFLVLQALLERRVSGLPRELGGLQASGSGKQGAPHTRVTDSGRRPCRCGQRTAGPGHLALSFSSTCLGTGVSTSLSRGPGQPRTPCVVVVGG